VSTEPGELQTKGVTSCPNVYALVPAPGFHSANWQKYENKELWVAEAVAKTGNRDWLWIDDQVPNGERLQHLGLDQNRCFKVNSKGANELEVLKEKLLQRLRGSKAV